MIIGLSGYAQSGKDTVANILVEVYGFRRVAFADKIRELLYEMDPPIKRKTNPDGGLHSLQSLVDAYGWEVTKQEPQVRQHLQNLGVGARKVFGDTFWVGQLLWGYDWSIPTVITDVRFQNEAHYLKKWSPDNTQIWRVKRPGIEAVNSHVSEHDLDDYKFDQILNNNGTLDDLRQMVCRRVEFSANAN